MRNLSVIKGVYQGNGVNTTWTIPFEYTDKSQIFVVLTTLSETGDYDYETVTSDKYTIDEDALTVTYPKTGDPIPNNQYLTVFRATDLLQLLDLTNQGGAWPEAIESALDKLTQIIQEHAEELARTLKVNIGDPESPEDKLLDMQTYVAAAADSAAAAATSEANAADSESNAATSATNAAASAAAAATSETNAAASAASALGSANSAANSAGVATGAAASANNSAVSAAASQQAAGDSAAAAANSQQIATMAASSALESKTAAELAATTATSQAAAVGVLATNAENTMAGYAAYSAPAWDSATVYSYPAVVSYPDGNTYRCLGTSVPAGTLPPESQQWIRITTRGGDDFWDIDVWGGMMPSENPTQSYGWTLDENGDFMPKDASDNLGREDKTIAEEALEEATAALEKATELLDATPMELDDDGNVTPVEIPEEDEEEEEP